MKKATVAYEKEDLFQIVPGITLTGLTPARIRIDPVVPSGMYQSSLDKKEENQRGASLTRIRFPIYESGPDAFCGYICMEMKR